MSKKEFLTIVPTFGNLETIKQTLPSVIEETKRNDAALIVFDCTAKNRDEQWDYLKKLNFGTDFFLMLSDRVSLAHSINAAMEIGKELYAPDYICIVEDDHGFKEGFIQEMISAMKKYYGKTAPNGLRFGLFSGAHDGLLKKKGTYKALSDGNLYPDISSQPIALGGVTNFCRCAPTPHWQNVLGHYDTDEYPISSFQTESMIFRNYFKGFTALFVGGDKLMFGVSRIGRGWSTDQSLKLWDPVYAKSDQRSNYLGKPGASVAPPLESFVLSKVKKLLK